MRVLNVIRAILLLSPLVCNSVFAIEQPIVVSFADQPINTFNQQLKQAQLQHRGWSKQPETISAHYAGANFRVAKVKQYQGKVLTYNVSAADAEHPKMLLILSLQKQQNNWKLDGARLAWKCKNGQHFSTDRCSISH
ncbi:hypothetical protein MSG37_02385 [Shewanella sp. 1CM18E]|uniref:hypothetical protein n=1 Tax=Shewanella sp. 1CM18E TaxID=2929169 RepID=UPI0020C0D496|nr:hypothetical protein [Shewanella sp. 1CM18E]MCK8043719.1 hypothetical protein [Shewanella sp. 1CM18E]